MNLRDSVREEWYIRRLVDWLWWGETDVSELQPVRVNFSSPGDCYVDHGWWYWLGLSPNVSTRALWQPTVLYGGPVLLHIPVLWSNTSLAATSTVWFPAIWGVSGASGRWAKEMRI
jgi:hypothetical protein